MAEQTGGRCANGASLGCWQVQIRVLGAMMLREIHARYGRSNVGFLWLIIEPLLLASVITLLHSVTMGHSEGGMQPYPFTVIGYCFVIIFRNNFSRSESALTSNPSVLYHAQVTPTDIVLARMTADTFGIIVAFLVLLGGGILFDLAQWPARPLYLFLAAAEITVWTFGLSMATAAYCVKYHVLGRLVHPIAYFMFPLSGAFFTLDFLPFWAREYMAWNPLMLMFETARYGQFQSASAHYIDHAYVILNCAISLFLGLLAVRRVRPFIHVH